MDFQVLAELQDRRMVRALRATLLHGVPPSPLIAAICFSQQGGYAILLFLQESGQILVPNVPASDVEKASAFYEEILGLEVLMDLGWIRTYGSGTMMTIQISVMSEGGSGMAVPDISIEVDDVGEALTRVEKAHIPVEYGPTTEPWGV